MRFLKAAKGYFKFQITTEEKEILFHLLGKYPLIPSAHQRLSHSGERPEDRQLLEEALTAQRQENRRLVERLLKAKRRFRATEKGCHFSLKAAEMEWLLQVLNDVRVGSWIILGSPDGPEKILAVLNKKTAPDLWTMETAGFFQMVFLKAATGGAAGRTEAT